MKFLFGAYRDWAIKAISGSKCLDGHEVRAECTPEAFNAAAESQDWDAIIVVGWSWKVPVAIVNSKLVVGMHPSDLPMYAGGSPIQNQILAGLTESKATLFKLNEKFDGGEIVDKEPISLTGHLDEVLSSIGHATSVLIDRFVTAFPNYTLTKQVGNGTQVRRLKPEHSRLQNPGLTCKKMWDIIRCHEDPYPNVYFEDETGRLTIKIAEFEEK